MMITKDSESFGMVMPKRLSRLFSVRFQWLKIASVIEKRRSESVRAVLDCRMASDDTTRWYYMLEICCECY